MKLVRNIAAVVCGYLIFAVSAVALFKLSGIDPHADYGFALRCVVVSAGIVFAFVGGYIAKLIAASRSLTVNLVLALVVAGFAAFSLFKSVGEHYTQISAILLFAPASVLGGYTRRRAEIV
ncbi:MAG TPA: hypothetical protein PLP07_13290 [Pyrinomonadaceae bacterium]|mgnify:CR=1 FL=1|jgi:hypothetical protein|nr:hypothetical protein [Chloracidobacterium sp.]MBP9935757.1 hypothetical protein [Pyrinomonadaceae bacterium]MBK7801290.1 hypothetical protein [Chloracidobacterium sp.]MBK9436611.1 hypothetical protein [Chloracidobacterium sp.]MBK9767509.1 hypothetical protein [Chloracidobacterium sp.]